MRRCLSFHHRTLRGVVGTLLTLAIIVAPAHGWGRDGHRIVGAIASKLLTEPTAAAVKSLLGEQSLADVSTWADEIRSNHAYDWAAPLHYVNVPKDAEFYDEARDCPERGCVVGAIEKYARVLGDADAAQSERAEALRFLVHFVGDIHQPLHAGLAADRGGNDIRVHFGSERRNLHEVWDTELIARARKPWEQYAAELSARINPELRESLRNADPAAWATESHKLALTCAYDIPASRELDNAYVDRAMPIVDQQLLAAGVRLADVLNRALDPQASAHSTPDATQPPIRIPGPLCRPR